MSYIENHENINLNEADFKNLSFTQPNLKQENFKTLNFTQPNLNQKQISQNKKVTFQKPEWLRKKIVPVAQKDMELLLNNNGLHTICQEAKCPNISECFAKKNATFLILGDTCTRKCTYCNVKFGRPDGVNESEISGILTSVLALGLKFVVITSPTRDDLDDGGALQFFKVTRKILTRTKDTKVELLIPDFRLKKESIKLVANSEASIVGHNVETIPRLYRIRKGAVYKNSLKVLEMLKTFNPNLKTKSALMVGLGESEAEMTAVFKDLLSVGCEFLSIGQYLAPTKQNEKVVEFVTPEQFLRYRKIALNLGFKYVVSSPYARSSYLAHEYLKT